MMDLDSVLKIATDIGNDVTMMGRTETSRENNPSLYVCYT